MISDNTKGNPNHDEEGKFTSAGNAGSKSETDKPKLKVTLKKDLNLDILNTKKENVIKPKISPQNRADLLEKLEDMTQLQRIPVLRNSKDIENNIEKFFSNQVIGHIDRLFGQSSDCADYQFHPKANKSIRLDIFPNIIGKYRYKKNHATIMPAVDFEKMLLSDREGRFERQYRGIPERGEDAMNILKNYCSTDNDNFDFYCPCGSNCYGSNIYTTVRINYAKEYARLDDNSRRWNQTPGTLIEGCIDSSGSHLTYDEVRRIKDSIDGNVIKEKVERTLISKGMEPNRANKIATSFSKSIKTDCGTVAVLLGLDYYIAAYHQRNLFNLSKWIIKGKGTN